MLAKITKLTYFNSMKNISTIFLTFLLSLSTLFSNVTGDYSLDVVSSGDRVTLTWVSGIEDNIREFAILRGRDRDNLSLIATVKSTGNNSTYVYVDENVYKTSGTIYAYGLALIDNSGNQSGIIANGQAYFENISGVKRTWGSIKALFR